MRLLPWSLRAVLAALMAAALSPSISAQSCGELPSLIFLNGAEQDDPRVFPDVRPVVLPAEDTPLSLSAFPLPPAAPTVQLSGHFSGPPGTGITVNRTPARLAGNRWWLPSLTLVPGSNLLRVVANTPAGEAAELELSIEYESTAPPARYVQIASAGIYAPAEVAFQLHPDAGFEPVQVRADFDGDGALDYVGPPSNAPLLHRYAEGGAFDARFTLLDGQGNEQVLESLVAIPVLGVTRQTLCHTWHGMTAKLTGGDIEGALAYIVPELRDFYRSLWQ